MKANKILCSVLSIACAVSGWLTMSGFTVSASAAEMENCSHAYKTHVVEPTCTAQGYTVYNCEKCGDTYNDNYVEANGHTYSDVVVDPTCTHKGYVAHYCTVCGNEYADSYVEAIGHNYVKDEKNPTCTETGMTTYVCANCGDVIKEPHDAKGHSYEVEVTEATCIAYGYTKHTCTDCDDTYVTDYVKPLGHDYEVFKVVADKDTLGYTKYQCKNCEYSYITDYVTSGDDGYLNLPVDDKKDEGEQKEDVNPTVPDDKKEPEETEKDPIIPDGPNDNTNDNQNHKHEYFLFYGKDEVAHVIQFGYNCECGEPYSGELKTLFSDENGNVTIVPVEAGMIDYSEMSGNFNVIVMDESGNTLTSFDVSNVKAENNTPNVPEQKEEEPPVEPDEKQEETKGDEEPDAPVKENKNLGLLLGIGIAMLVIAAGLVTTLIVIKKKNKNN